MTKRYEKEALDRYLEWSEPARLEEEQAFACADEVEKSSEGKGKIRETIIVKIVNVYHIVGGPFRQYRSTPRAAAGPDRPLNDSA